MAALTLTPKQIHKFARLPPEELEKPPPIAVRYFYASSLTIDDPLSPVPPPSNSGVTSAIQPRPFSAYDHAALEKSWKTLQKQIEKYKEEQAKEQAQERLLVVADSKSERSLDLQQGQPESSSRPPSRASQRPSSSGKVKPSLCIGGRRASDPKRVLSTSPSNLDVLRRRPYESHRSSLSRDHGFSTSDGKASPSLGPIDDTDLESVIESEPGTAGTTGTPFIRAPSRSKITSALQQINKTAEQDSEGSNKLAARHDLQQVDPPINFSKKVTVGTSRLHEVSLPDLQMLPIYWSPVHDVSAIIRGTWFYKDSMLPVETDIANMLEAGYIGMQPWTETWNDELNSAVEVGAAGEMKIIHNLWPPAEKKRMNSRPSSVMGITTEEPPDITPDMHRKELLRVACSLVDGSTKGSEFDNKAAGNSAYGRDGQQRQYLQGAVIYANATTAYLLKPNLQPSAYYGRRPLANYIRKGHKIGICVVRGFDQEAWEKIHPSKAAAKIQPNLSPTTTVLQIHGDQPSEIHQTDTIPPTVTDLVLVLHGIGQKASERMENWHFTHAMNSFRREVNVEHVSPKLKRLLRKEAGNIMVLPVNWRLSLSFEEGGYREGTENSALNEFTLQDITPPSLPSVRQIISDVMLDVPYYMSHHQPKMIAAVIKEANRIYYLWCKNNPGFESYGRVHLIAHSLGSVMAVDILSKQPTTMHQSSLSHEENLDPAHFAFDTKNLFLCGSPVGFFLLLKRAALLPRRGRNKPGAEGEDTTPGVAGDEGTYGCLAVDNVYNIINPYDPVAYSMNAAVDSVYAASLKAAYVPSASTSWFAFSNPFKPAPAAYPSKQRAVIARMPSNVELETHNFTREEIAEKRAYLLNDNGQIDFFLRYGGGPLEIEYLTMLGAHSSYWLSRDFVRFIVIETGRNLGKDGTMEAARPIKKKQFAT